MPGSMNTIDGGPHMHPFLETFIIGNLIESDINKHEFTIIIESDGFTGPNG